MINNYKVYGLNIRSEIEIDEFDKLDEILEKNIVNIRYDKISTEIKDKIFITDMKNKTKPMKKLNSYFHRFFLQ